MDQGIKLLRTTGYVLRFIAILKNGKGADQIELTASEVSMADSMWTQASLFPLKLQRVNSGESPVYSKQLLLYLDDKLIHCHERISQCL